MIKIKSPAKVNLALDILGKTKSGFHKIKTIFQEIDLADEIYLEKNDRVVLTCNNPEIPLDEKNAIIKTVNLLKKRFKIKEGIKISLMKNIPVGFGLGGGSSNAASVLKALNKIWKLTLTKEKMAEIGKKIGMDVPFFIYGGTALGTHFGEKIKVLPKMKRLFLILINQNIPIKTEELYKKIDLGYDLNRNEISTNQLLQILEKQKNYPIFPYLHNDFEMLINQLYKLIRRIGSLALKEGANAVEITGASTTLVCYFENRKERDRVFEKIKGEYKWVKKVETS